LQFWNKIFHIVSTIGFLIEFIEKVMNENEWKT